MTPKTLLLPVLLFGTLMMVSTPSFAQSNEDRAYALATQGADLFERGEFREAASRFEQAYALVRDSVLLKNQIVSLYKAGDCKNSLDLAYQYDISYQDAPATDKEDVRQVRVDCNLTAAETALEYGKFDVAKESADRAAKIGVVGDEVTRLSKIQSQIKTDAEKSQIKTDAEKPREVSQADKGDPQTNDDPNWWRPIVGYSAVGAGAVVVGISAALHISDIGKADDLGCDDITAGCTAAQISEYNELADGEGKYVAGYFIGGAFIAGGAGLLIYHYAIDQPAENVAFIPVLSPHGVGASFELKF